MPVGYQVLLVTHVGCTAALKAAHAAAAGGSAMVIEDGGGMLRGPATLSTPRIAVFGIRSVLLG